MSKNYDYIYTTIIRYKDKKTDELLPKEKVDEITGGDEELIEKNYELVEIDINVCYAGRWEDEGIGYYEYWGFKGCHHDWVFHVEEDDLDSVLDNNDDEWLDKLTDSEIKKILDLCIEDGYKQAG